jgi:iron complex outermembrane recepter protein
VIVEDGVEIDEEDGLPVFRFVQEDANFFGGEVYADFAVEGGPLGADWSFDASVDFVNAELDSGDNVPFIPPLTLNAGASAEWGAFELGGAVSVAGEQNDPGVGQLKTDGYTTLDLRAELDLSDFGFGADGTEAFIEARNITDEEIRFATSVLKDVAPAPGQNFRFGIRATF